MLIVHDASDGASCAACRASGTPPPPGTHCANTRFGRSIPTNTMPMDIHGVIRTYSRMPNILQIEAQNTIFTALQYPRSNAEATAMGLKGGRNEEMRALTIAAFRVAQNQTQLSTRAMDGELLLYLLAGSATALGHWVSKGRLSQLQSGYQLTPTGLVECQDTLLGQAGSYNTTETKVQEWVTRLVHGDEVVSLRRTFSSAAWPPE